MGCSARTQRAPGPAVPFGHNIVAVHGTAAVKAHPVGLQVQLGCGASSRAAGHEHSVGWASRRRPQVQGHACSRNGMRQEADDQSRFYSTGLTARERGQDKGLVRTGLLQAKLNVIYYQQRCNSFQAQAPLTRTVLVGGRQAAVGGVRQRDLRQAQQLGPLHGCGGRVHGRSEGGEGTHACVTRATARSAQCV